MKKILIILLLLSSKLSFADTLFMPPCPKEMYLRLGWNGECVAKCPSDYPIREGNRCFPADAPYILKISKSECKKYPERFYLSSDNSVAKKGGGFLKSKLYPAISGCYLRPNDDKPLLRMILMDGEGNGQGGYDTRSYTYGEQRPKYLYLYACSTNENLPTLPEFCDKCPNREYKDGLCQLKECPLNHFRTATACVSCAEMDSRKATREECNKCSGRTFNSLNNACVNCDTQNILSDISREDCLLCPNRSYEDGKCILNRCQEGYVRDNSMKCKQVIGSIENISKEECDKAGYGYFYIPEQSLCKCYYDRSITREECLNNYTGTFWRPDPKDPEKGECKTGESAKTVEECHQVKNYAWSTSGDCKNCWWYLGRVDKSECDRCPNLMWDEKGQECVVSPNEVCPSNDVYSILIKTEKCCYQRPHHIWGQHNEERSEHCYDCDAAHDVYATKENCDRCPNRSYIDGKCVINTRPIRDNYGPYIRKNNGEWAKCFLSPITDTTKTECDICDKYVFFEETKTCMYCISKSQNECEEISSDWKYDLKLGLCCRIK